MLLVGRQEGHPACKNRVVRCWRVCLLERGADLQLHMAQLMPLPLTVSCFSKIQIGFTFLVPAHLGSPGKRAVKRACVYFAVMLWSEDCRAKFHGGIFQILLYIYPVRILPWPESLLFIAQLAVIWSWCHFSWRQCLKSEIHLFRDVKNFVMGFCCDSVGSVVYCWCWNCLHTYTTTAWRPFVLTLALNMVTCLLPPLVA